MGKAQKKRSFRRHNPVRVPDSHLPRGLDAAAATSSKKNDVLPIIQKIESNDAHERTWACSAVSNLIQNDPSTRRLLQGKNIVGVLINRLSDNVEEVVVEAAGALRNLCIDGGFEICAEMYNKNILTPLKSFVPKISTALDLLLNSPASAPENTHDLVYGLAENVITLFWCLSETSNKALNAVNDARLVPFLMAFLEHRSKLPSRTVAAAAQSLYVLSDDNPSPIEELRSNSSYTACLLSVAQDDSPISPESKDKDVQELIEERRASIRLLASGILRNISPIPAPSVASTIDISRNVVLPLIAPLLASTPLSEASDRVVELVSQEDNTPVQKPAPSIKNALKTDHKSPKELALERIEARLRNVQLALEILTGVCATLPDPEPSAPGESEEDEENVDGDDDGMDADDNAMEDGVMQRSPSPLQNGKTNPAPVPATSAFLPSILPLLLELIQPTPTSFPPIISPSATLAPPPSHPPTTSALSAIHVCALECLNNIFLSLSLSGNKELQADKSAGERVWNGVWEALGKVGLEGGPGQERRKEIWEVAVGVMWGIGGIWRGTLVPNGEQVKLLMQLCDASTDDQVKVKCIGALESLAQHPTSLEANQIISAYLINLASTPPSITLTAEPIFQAASALIDIYSDEDQPYDTNFRQGNYLQALSGAIDTVRRAVRSVDRKKDGGRALRARGEEILDNLRAFVKYRRSLRL